MEARHAGGWARVVVWIGAIVSACSFTWVYLTLLAIAASWFGYLGPAEISFGLNLGYVIAAPAVVLTALLQPTSRWAAGYRKRAPISLDAPDYGAFELDYGANHNITDLPQAFKAATHFLNRGGDSGDSDGDSGKLIALGVIAALALACGALTTATLIKRYAAVPPLPAATNRPPTPV